MYATCIDTCSTLKYINYIHIQVRGGGGGGGVRTPRTPPLRPPLFLLKTKPWLDVNHVYRTEHGFFFFLVFFFFASVGASTV